MQKLPVAGSRSEFMISVPSLCHWTYPASSCAPSGGLKGAGLFSFPLEVHVTLQSPTMESFPSLSMARSSSRTTAAEDTVYETGRRTLDCGRGANIGLAELGPTPRDGPHLALATGTKALAKATAST